MLVCWSYTGKRYRKKKTLTLIICLLYDLADERDLLVEENRFDGSGMLSEGVPTLGCRELTSHAGFMGSTHPVLIFELQSDLIRPLMRTKACERPPAVHGWL